MPDKNITEKRLARLEQVFEAIANAWASASPGSPPASNITSPPPAVGSAGAGDAGQMLGSSLVEKLGAFSAGLTEREQQQLALDPVYAAHHLAVGVLEDPLVVLRRADRGQVLEDGVPTGREDAVLDRRDRPGGRSTELR